MNEMMTRDEMVQKHEAMMAEVLAKHGDLFLKFAADCHPDASTAEHEFLRDQMARMWVSSRLAK